MQVILLADVAGLGKKLDVKDVNGGYARNFLFPRGLAKLGTPEALKGISALKARQEKEGADYRRHLEELARQLESRTLLFELKIDKTGGVFGSVSKEAILKGLRENGLITKERVEIKLDHPLKSLGEHEIEVDLKKGVKAKLKVMLQKQA